MRIRLPNLLDWSDFPSHWPLYVNSLLLILSFSIISLVSSDSHEEQSLSTRLSWSGRFVAGEAGSNNSHRYGPIQPPLSDLFFRYPELDSGPMLPGWMQDLLNDPGWNQPYIEPRAATPMPAPSYDELVELTRERMANPPALVPKVGPQQNSAAAQ